MNAIDAATTLLGGCTPRRFLAQHWQKRPLLIRAAIPGFAGVLSAAELAELACRDDAQSRLVIRRGREWESQQGPFEQRVLRRLPARGWSLLVNDVNHFVPAARTLLDRFNFIPHARLDDLMVSFAPIGGGVGPHVDSYDVFLLQGPGRRRWQISHQRDLTLVAGAPLKLLRHFRAEQEFTLAPGDMLYLPPGWAHEGVALDPCMTYSVGFRAPAWHELGIHFLRFLEDRIEPSGQYADPDLGFQDSPGRIGRRMVDKVAEHLESIRWRAPDVARFLGQYLTEPKAHVFFSPAHNRLRPAAFAARVRDRGVALDLHSQMLYFGDQFFINGTAVQVKGRARATLSRLADARWLPYVDTTQRGLIALLHEWYVAGYLDLRADASAKRRGS
jgi:50S ribosomal protein L16 3-hydroxylase